MRTDFDRWIEYHCKAFPGFAKWIADNSEQKDHIRRVLGAYTYEQLRDATDTAYGSENQPQGFSKHAARLRTLVNSTSEAYQPRQRGPQVVDDRLVASCQRCQDFGLVSVLNPNTIKRIRSAENNHAIITCSIRCDCRLGDHYRGARWEEGHCFIRYEDVLEAAISRRSGDLFDDMWFVAVEMVRSRDEELRPKPHKLSAASLP